jgi:glycogen phosphorylase
LKRVLDTLAHGEFSPGEPERYRGLVDGLLNRDTYMLMADFADYVVTQAQVDALWQQPAAWAERAIRNIAAMGFFSSDRTIREYVEKIWVAPKRR